MNIVLGILYVSITVIVLVILYRLLIKKLNKGNLDPTLFCELETLDEVQSHGVIDFCFRCKQDKKVDFEIVTLNFDQVYSVASKDFPAGQHILKFDTTLVENGEYFYLLKTDNQQIFKKILIAN